MNELDTLTANSRIYVDTNIFIYFIETDGLHQQEVLAAFETADTSGARLVTSEITLAECIYQPARDNNAALIQKYELLLEDSANVETVPLAGGLPNWRRCEAACLA
jgi:predicted nucleic acid-binding protein